MMMRVYACAVVLLLAATHATAQQVSQDTVQAVADEVADRVHERLGLFSPTPPPGPNVVTPAPTTAAAATTVPVLTTTPALTTTPIPTTTPAPTTTPGNITFSVPLALGNTTDPNLLQEGSGSYAPGGLEPPTINATLARFVVIGDVGRQRAAQSLGLPQCAAATYGGNNDVQGSLQQNETAQLMDQVCGLVGGCSFVLNTGDNFYQCGIYQGDYSRFQSDWIQVYQTPYTPNIKNLPWFSVFGNHDIVINGSVQTQINFDTLGASPVSAQSPLAPAVTKLWNMPAQFYLKDYAINGVTIRGIFLDANPFITSYNAPTQKYHSAYYVANHNQAYEQAQIQFLQNALNTSTATYNFVTAHYPIFGGATQYGANGSAYPGEFNFWADVIATINSNSKKVVSYFNGHDHAMNLGDPTTNAAQPWNNYITYLSSGAGSWGEPADTCTPTLYTNAGGGGFIIVTASATQWRSDYYTLGSTYPQCTVTSYADKRPPTFSANCALGKPNACCTAGGCFKK